MGRISEREFDVAEINPLKQGLKHTAVVPAIVHVSGVAEINPLKQGLKLNYPFNSRPWLNVAEINPLKQGLKRIEERAIMFEYALLQR